MKRRFICPHCGNEWIMSYWKWLFTTPVHMFSFVNWKDYRKTKCPFCKKKGWLECHKV